MCQGVGGARVHGVRGTHGFCGFPLAVIDVTDHDALMTKRAQDGDRHETQATRAHDHDPVVIGAGLEFANGAVGGES